MPSQACHQLKAHGGNGNLLDIPSFCNFLLYCFS